MSKIKDEIIKKQEERHREQITEADELFLRQEKLQEEAEQRDRDFLNQIYEEETI